MMQQWCLKVLNANSKTFLISNFFFHQKDISDESIISFFTDSFDDLPLARISKKITIVDGDNMFSCKNIDEFKDFFRK